MQNKIISLKLDRNLIILFFFFGCFLNYAVISTNGNKMPVKTNYIIDESEHFTFQDENNIKYPELADIYKIKLPKNKIMYYSVGDVFIWFFSIITIIYQIRIINLERKLKKIKGLTSF